MLDLTLDLVVIEYESTRIGRNSFLSFFTQIHVSQLTFLLLIVVFTGRGGDGFRNVPANNGGNFHVTISYRQALRNQ